jgi:hypothetical protein
VVAKETSPILFWASASSLIIAVALTTIAAHAGVPTQLAVYAAAVGAWYFVVRDVNKTSFRTAALLGLAMQIAAALQAPLSAAALAGDLAIGKVILAKGAVDVAPWYALLLAGWTAAGGALLVRRAFLIAALIGGAWCLRNDEKPRFALAFVTFPLMAIGTVNASFTVAAAALLAAGYAAVEHKRSGVAAATATLAAGIAAPAIAALPIYYEASWAMFIFLASLIITALVPRFLLPSIGGWSGMVKGTIAGSPILAFVAQRVESLLHSLGAAKSINEFISTVARRGGWTLFGVNDAGLAVGIVFFATILAIVIAAHGVKKTAAALADAIGLMLLVSTARDPMLWLLVVPFAIAGNRRLWLFVAIASPILWLGTGWTFYLASLLLPALAFAAIKLHET